MKKTINSACLVFLTIFFFGLLLAINTPRIFAAATPTNPIGQPSAATSDSAVDCTPDSGSSTICNPLPSPNIQTNFMNILKYVMGTLGVIAVVIIVIAGFRMVVSAGNDKAVAAAKNSIQYAVLGLIISALAYTIIAILQNVLHS